MRVHPGPVQNKSIQAADGVRVSLIQFDNIQVFDLGFRILARVEISVGLRLVPCLAACWVQLSTVD